jgi:hypothetical protein
MSTNGSLPKSRDPLACRARVVEEPSFVDACTEVDEAIEPDAAWQSSATAAWSGLRQLLVGPAKETLSFSSDILSDFVLSDQVHEGSQHGRLPGRMPSRSGSWNMRHLEGYLRPDICAQRIPRIVSDIFCILICMRVALSCDPSWSRDLRARSSPRPAVHATGEVSSS